MIQEQSSLVELQVPTRKLNIGIMEEKERQLALELMAKYNLGGATIGDSAGSVILSLSTQKKRDQKSSG
jgi:hypothetical protein